jgi:hypothetical protein
MFYIRDIETLVISAARPVFMFALATTDEKSTHLQASGL